MAKKNNFTKLSKLKKEAEKLSEKYKETQAELAQTQQEALAEIGKAYMRKQNLDIDVENSFKTALRQLETKME
ncbi:hypothetical protein EFN43_02130 [Pediococcus pentosaceus]|jgi:hypothetical protein|uniref:hypothetical protein n=1 Tax=Pediococcus pentosaceus TaxID=1255 RepID=UPI001C1ED055|nr:hypothetical protein [Pediococcus pentosaceus]MBU7002092.1 hypothetical protein [Pediococcus pentosaceus]MCG9227416.1 hypothetical protein [Pediococcus pentosaceus]MCT3019885.1 hypothetical protein [Pediococcus pentosaceus]MDA8037447.1 hypothetical protein [Pediococcus pentosaceus]